MIKIRDLWKSYGKLQVLKGLNLEIIDGEVLVILGRSGVGKSVLAMQIGEAIARGKPVEPLETTAKPQKVLYFDAHDDLAYAKAVEILDLSRLGGARSIAILTQRVVQ